MRKTAEELKEDFPWMEGSKRDIVGVHYGDVPYCSWNKEEYEKWSKLSGTVSNIQAVDAYIYKAYGDYDIYSPEVGRIAIDDKGNLLHGDVNVVYRGKVYTIYVNRMYGLNSLTILGLTGQVEGFSNKNGMASPSKSTKEMDREKIEHVLNVPLKDYGKSVQQLMKVAREMYSSDPENYILQKG